MQLHLSASCRLTWWLVVAAVADWRYPPKSWACPSVWWLSCRFPQQLCFVKGTVGFSTQVFPGINAVIGLAYFPCAVLPCCVVSNWIFPGPPFAVRSDKCIYPWFCCGGLSIPVSVSVWTGTKYLTLLITEITLVTGKSILETEPSLACPPINYA